MSESVQRPNRTEQQLARVAFTATDVAGIRFAISPLWQIGTAFRMLQVGPPDPAHRRWVRETWPRVAATGLDRGWLAALVTAGFVADLLTPTPGGPSPTLEDEITAILSTPEPLVRRDVARLRDGRGRPTPRLSALESRPRAALASVAEEVDAFWRIALAPYWDRIRAVLDADVHRRAQLVAEHGVGRLLKDLHPLVDWDGEALQVRRRVSQPEDRTAGLLLIPCVFKGSGLATRQTPRSPWQLAYRAHAAGTLWQAGATRGVAELAAVLGRSRARLLLELDSPVAVSDLARRTGLSMAAVSENLTALRNAGFASTHRSGRYVLYARTAVGDAVVRAAQ